MLIESNIAEFIKRWNITTDQIPDVLESVAEELGAEAVRLFRGTVRSWRHKPTFQALTEVRGGDITVLAGTDDQTYLWVDKGTRAHIIRPRWAPALRFNTVFSPKTRPGSLQSSAGRSGPPVAFAQVVHHPGTQARGFSELVATKVSAKAGPALSRRIKKWLRS